MENRQEVNQINELLLRFSLSPYQLADCANIDGAAILA
jgi:hypothetical protein